MAEIPPTPSPARTHPHHGPGSESNQFWCYHCDKRVAVETLPDLPDVVCRDCNNGFVESIPAEPTLGNQFAEVLRLIAQAAREDDAPPPQTSDPFDDEYRRIQLDRWDNNAEDDGDDDDEHSVEVVPEDATDGENEDDDEDEIDAVDPSGHVEEDEDEMRRRRRDELRLRFRDLASQVFSRGNRILDLAEVLMGLEDNLVEMRLQLPQPDTYVGNPRDYVNATEYEALLQNLAESDSSGRGGAPPASKVSVESLETVLIQKEENAMVCAICKDTVSVGEIAKNLPCGHGYHDGCIVVWLESRNSCPICRFELPTDDPDYEEERKKRTVVSGLRAASSSSSGLE